jgi:hypothetical protein
VRFGCRLARGSVRHRDRLRSPHVLERPGSKRMECYNPALNRIVSASSRGKRYVAVLVALLVSVKTAIVLSSEDTVSSLAERFAPQFMSSIRPRMSAISRKEAFPLRYLPNSIGRPPWSSAPTVPARPDTWPWARSREDSTSSSIRNAAQALRIISLRRTNNREVKRYEKAKS